MFVGRDRELAALENLYRSGAFEMPVIYGRRRVGKTRLITEFIKGKRAVYVQARRTNAEVNLALLSQAITSFSSDVPMPAFSSFDAAFDALLALSCDERLVFVIDEFPYLAQSFPEISSLLQARIDHDFKESSQLMLILCGSSLSFMEEQVLGYESPLYGRRTAQFKIEPFDFFATRKFWSEVRPEDAALLYGCTGGIPAYIEKVDARLSVAENLERLYFAPEGYLFEEPGNLLLQECRSPEQYDAVIQAIANGKTKVSEIAAAAKIVQSNTSGYLRKLGSLGVVERELPFGEASNKKAVYKLKDTMFRFWYRFVSQNLGLIANGLGHAALERSSASFPEYMGPVFEDICLQYVYRMARSGNTDVLPAVAGRWWGNDARTRSQEEIDLVVSDGAGKALFGECKWRNEAVGRDVAEKLVYRSELLRFDQKRYVVFSKTGFTDACRSYALARGDMTLLTFTDMCSAVDIETGQPSA